MATPELSTIFTNRYGKPVIDESTGDPVTIRDLALAAIDTQIQGDDNPALKNRLIALGDKLATGNPELSAKEITLVVTRAQKALNANQAGQLIKVLDPAELDTPEPKKVAEPTDDE